MGILHTSFTIQQEMECQLVSETQLIHKDCVIAMQQMSDNCIEAIITDPPYEMQFMGRKWDNTGIAYNIEMWKEALRVLKPGGYLLSFSSTRTFHRMACAIEDAGFKIIDTISWLYGCLTKDVEVLTTNGWKFSDHIYQGDKIMCFDGEELYFDTVQRIYEYNNFLPAYHIQSEDTDHIVSMFHKCVVKREDQWTLVRAEELNSNEQIAIVKNGEVLPSNCAIKETKWFDVMWCVTVPTGMFLARRHGREFITGNSGMPKGVNVAKQIEAKLTTGSANRTRFKDLDGEKSVASIGYAKTHGENDRPANYNGRECVINTIFHTQEAQQWADFHSLLKPAQELICVAQKPISEKTIADNILKWGCGAFNIGECRIGNETISNHGGNNKGGIIYGNGKGLPNVERGANEHNGRFATNVILDNVAAEALDKQTGILSSGTNCVRRKDGHFMEHGGMGKAGDVQHTYGDSGGASRFYKIIEKQDSNDSCVENTNRFFYCGKASKKEKGTYNTHVTVKPLKLMEYLVRLVSKQNQTVLDCFMGSGTTGIACKHMGRNFIGIEKEQEYFDIAKKRIQNA